MGSEQRLAGLTVSLAGRVAVVTGGASGIGASITRAFVESGARTGVVDLKAGAEPAAGPDGLCTPFSCDISDAASVAATVTAILEEYGRVDVLVNNAGISILGPAEEFPASAWDKVLAVNVRGTFLMSQAIGHHMLSMGGGKIINIASQAATVALKDHVAYCASKAAVLGLTRVLACEWADRGVTVNAVSPTIVMTEMGKKVWGGKKGDAMKALIPTGRFAEPEEVAAAVLFLASDSADMINGANIAIDGGYTVQ